MTMATSVLLGIAVVGTAQLVSADETLEMVNVVVIEAAGPDSPDRILITGRNFNNFKEMQITLGSTQLEVLEFTATVILTEIPAQVVPGDYELIMWSEAGSIREASMDITLGTRVAEGSDGSKGSD